MFRRILLAAIVFAIGCGSGGPDPRVLIPVDSDAWVAIRPAQEIADRVLPIVEQYPEYGGAVDFVRSVAGIDYSLPDRESGLDPRRGVAAAWWRGGFLLLLPVSDASLANRRLALRLARFGFVQSANGGPVRQFHSADRGHACFEINHGVAAIFVGQAETCSLLGGVAATADDSRESAVRRTVENVSTEMAIEGADIIFHAGNQVVAPELLRRAGIPARGAAAMVMSGMIGDLRGAVYLDRVIRLRLALGSEGDPFVEPVADPSGAGQPKNAVEVDVTVGRTIRPLLDSAVSMCGRRCTSRGIDMMFASWDGRMKLTVPSVIERPDGGRPGGILDSLLALTDKITVTAVAGTRHSSDEIVGIVRKRVQSAGLPVAPDGPVSFKFEGHDVAVASSVSALSVAAGPAALTAATRAAGAFGASGLPASTEGPRLASVKVNPEGLLNISGFGFLEYLRRLVNPVRMAGLDVYYEQGRVIVDGRIFIR